uniref:Putative ribonuclease H-like domain-containing protein n=1 Tax=Tanacetum cinerariifolium TaxID=118510 RepID=A0A699HLB8_TANCI|nr:putative ribonuclease H-like domain-containing protein [Tanacetum cinerariifolium]
MAREGTSQPLPPPIASTEAPQMVSYVKLPILKKVQMTKDEAGNEVKVPLVTAHQILAMTRERKAKSILLMAILDEHLARFHGIKDAKTLLAAIKTRFGEGLDKGYDRFQRLISLLGIHGAVNAASTLGTFSAGGPSCPHLDAFIPANTLLHVDRDDSQIPNLEDTAELRSTGIFTSAYGDDFDIFTSPVQRVGVEADFNNKDSSTVDKYVDEILKKFDFSSVKTASTPIETHKPLVKDEEAADVDVHLHRSMIGSLMYLIASRPDIVFAVCTCSRFQVTPKLSHLHAIKQIFGYLKGQPKLGLWYPRDSPFDLEAYSDSDYTGANLDKKSIRRTVTPVFTTMLAPPAVVEGEGGGDSLVQTATTASLNAQQYSINITKTQSKATFNEPTPQGEGSGSGLGRQETMGGYTVGSGEDMMEHDIKLMDPIPQTPYDSPLSGGHTPGKNVKTAQAKKIPSLKKRVTKLEQRQSSRFSGFHPFRAGSSKRHSLGRRKVSKHTAETISTTRPNISAARLELSTAEPKSPPTTTLFNDEDVSIVDTLVKMKNQKAKEKGISFKDVDDSARPIRSITTLQPLPTIDPKDKGRFTHAQLKSKSFEEIQKIYIKEQKRVIGSKKMKRELEVERKEQQFPSNDLEVYDLILWGDLKTLVESKKRYPLTKEILKKMLSSRLEAKTESTLALDLIKFIKLHIEEKLSVWIHHPNDHKAYTKET